MGCITPSGYSSIPPAVLSSVIGDAEGAWRGEHQEPIAAGDQAPDVFCVGMAGDVVLFANSKNDGNGNRVQTFISRLYLQIVVK